MVMLHDAVVRGQPTGGGRWSRGGRGEKLGRFGQLGLNYRVKRNVGVKMEKRIGT
jgi:ribosomal protein L13E